MIPSDFLKNNCYNILVCPSLGWFRCSLCSKQLNSCPASAFIRFQRFITVVAPDDLSLHCRAKFKSSPAFVCDRRPRMYLQSRYFLVFYNNIFLSQQLSWLSLFEKNGLTDTNVVKVVGREYLTFNQRHSKQLFPACVRSNCSHCPLISFRKNN